MNNTTKKIKRKKSEAGFIMADFIFSFVLVLGVGIFIFALTFSLATIEISQYIVWSAARNFSSANISEAQARLSSTKKFKALSEQFPLLTGAGGAESPWFELNNFTAENHENNPQFSQKVTNASDRLNRDGSLERRQPWIGASASIYLKLFGTMNVPFFGRVTDDPESTFKFRVYAFILRHPSNDECRGFFEKRFSEGIKTLAPMTDIGDASKYYPPEDNGC
jgi:hypothetical protein